jgi:arylsulfatase A-like enzyme
MSGRSWEGYARNKLEFFVFKSFVNTSPLQLIEPWYTASDTELRKQGLPQSEVSLFEAFQAAGYRTGCIGKWHLGYHEPFLPQNKGVDDFYGFYEAFSLYGAQAGQGHGQAQAQDLSEQGHLETKAKGPLGHCPQWSGSG